MSEMTAVPADDPLMVAWKAYEATADYRNTRTWALKPEHVDGSLWAAFMHGWQAHDASKCPACGSPSPELHPADEPGDELGWGKCGDPFHAASPTPGGER